MKNCPAAYVDFFVAGITMHRSRLILLREAYSSSTMKSQSAFRWASNFSRHGFKVDMARENEIPTHE
ncbi:MAG TPA: hypothetical protein VJT15_01810 [Pyrinomonadaceae bacterium]|nr:hypothetical protein [Pyrinomonadaceae bacterium]